MEAVVIDTDVLSFLAKADTRAGLYTSSLVEKRLCICFQTVAELRLWTIVRQWGEPRKTALDSLLNQFVVLPYDSMMAQHWADITFHRRRIGRHIDCGDAWVAASALRHNAVLVTHNGKHYLNIPGLKVISHAN